MITECFVDGSHRPQGSAAAVVIYVNRKEVFRTVKPVVTKSSNIAEAEAIILALNLCYIARYNSPTIYTDSKVLFNQYHKKSGIRSFDTLLYMETLWETQKIFPFQLKNVPRKDVQVPDDICKKFLLSIDKKYEKD